MSTPHPRYQGPLRIRKPLHLTRRKEYMGTLHRKPWECAWRTKPSLSFKVLPAEEPGLRTGIDPEILNKFRATCTRTSLLLPLGWMPRQVTIDNTTHEDHPHKHICFSPTTCYDFRFETTSQFKQLKNHRYSARKSIKTENFPENWPRRPSAITPFAVFANFTAMHLPHPS